MVLKWGPSRISSIRCQLPPHILSFQPDEFLLLPQFFSIASLFDKTTFSRHKTSHPFRPRIQPICTMGCYNGYYIDIDWTDFYVFGIVLGSVIFAVITFLATWRVSPVAAKRSLYFPVIFCVNTAIGTRTGFKDQHPWAFYAASFLALFAADFVIKYFWSIQRANRQGMESSDIQSEKTDAV